MPQLRHSTFSATMKALRFVAALGRVSVHHAPVFNLGALRGVYVKNYVAIQST
jgi:hypothetical protein